MLCSLPYLQNVSLLWHYVITAAWCCPDKKSTKLSILDSFCNSFMPFLCMQLKDFIPHGPFRSPLFHACKLHDGRNVYCITCFVMTIWYTWHRFTAITQIIFYPFICLQSTTVLIIWSYIINLLLKTRFFFIPFVPFFFWLWSLWTCR